MGFFIELSYSLSLYNSTEIKEKILNKSLELRCDFNYNHIEYFKKKTSQIMSFSFPEHDEIFIEFIYFVKKIPHIYIETAGIDDLKFTQLYASRKYMGSMEKELAQKYIINKKNGNLKKINPLVYNALIKKVKKVF